GGLIAFGVIGLFIGPVVLAVAYTLLVDWVSEGGPHERQAPPLSVPRRATRSSPRDRAGCRQRGRPVRASSRAHTRAAQKSSARWTSAHVSIGGAPSGRRRSTPAARSWLVRASRISPSIPALSMNRRVAGCR